ncbi:MAG: hypothetical protein AAF317_01115 [Pseudomonadota bacterium]
MSIELLKDANVVIGLLIGLFTIVSAMIVWFDRRQKAFASKAVEKAEKTSADLAAKVDLMEDDLGAVAQDISSVKSDVRKLFGRMHGVEKSMQTVAQQADLAGLNAEVKQLTGTVMAEIRVLSNMMHSFHVSALRAAERKDKT